MFFLLGSIFAIAQKKPLNHAVYDSWESLGDRKICHNGQFVAYKINVQEGDDNLIIQNLTTNYLYKIPRGYDFNFTENDEFLVCKIKPLYADIRLAKIKKTKSTDMPKDSIAILNLKNFEITKFSEVISYQLPKKNSNVLAIYFDKKNNKKNNESMQLDSVKTIENIQHSIDSLKNVLTEIYEKGIKVLKKNETKNDNKINNKIEEGKLLVLIHLQDFSKDSFQLVNKYLLNKKGNFLIMETSKSKTDTNIKTQILVYDIQNSSKKNILSDFNDAENLTFNDSKNMVAFLATKDTNSIQLERNYKLYISRMDNNLQTLDNNDISQIKNNFQIAYSGNLFFNELGNKLFFEIKPKYIPMDTSLPEFERVKLDIWHYNDKKIQPVQLKNMEADLKKGYLTVLNFDNNKLFFLQDTTYDRILKLTKGNELYYYALSTSLPNQISSQWLGYTIQQISVLDANTNIHSVINNNFKGSIIEANNNGTYLVYYDEIKKKYFSYNAKTKTTKIIATDIPEKLYDEENDVPDDANGHGIQKFYLDHYILIYDKFDLWQVDLNGLESSKLLTFGRPKHTRYRVIDFVEVDYTSHEIDSSNTILIFNTFNELNKNSGISTMNIGTKKMDILIDSAVYISSRMERNNFQNMYKLLFSVESYQNTPNLFLMDISKIKSKTQITNLNLQQKEYNWGTSEIFKWTSYTNKKTEGILYKPTNFDPLKKYPMIVYFYDRSSESLNNYIAPAPTPSRLNISFFVSRGYIVFVPDIWYTIGQPGNSAYNYILSGTRAVVKLGFIDSTKIGLQGQSWGGYQIAYLITKTKLFACAWAGAPVVNMTSAYGGIRWGTGLNRQFQYEKTQSRIGASLWENPKAYIENSPLFSLPKVETPIVIMSNDADDAVPWYQGIEMFTALRRLHKKVWLLNYNNEAHNLIERKNRKDISIREQQFFDYYLKNEKPAKWIIDGLPATLKGRTLGTETNY